jgi:hypothetical protein
LARNTPRAAKLAPEFYRYLPDARGRAPMGVRITSTSELMRRGGEDAITRAAADLKHSAKS